MELTRMKLADLRPNPGNLRKEFNGIEELADLLDLTPGAPGEPLIPLIALRDANVARIVDGERRFRAMKLRGRVDGCNVLLCDDMEDVRAAEKVIMLLTNMHEGLTGDEFSAGVQEVMLLGVPEADVDKIAGRKGAGRALRHAVERNGGKVSEQLSIDRALAAEEVIEAGGSQDDYDAVMSEKNFTWKKNSIISRIEDEREGDERERAVAEVIEAHGLVVTDKKPKGALLRRNWWKPKPEEIRMEWPTLAAAGCTVVRPRDGYSSWEVYNKPVEVSDEEAAAIKSKNATRRMRTAGQKRRAEWLHARLMQGGGGMAGLSATEFFVSGWFEDNRSYSHHDFLKRAGLDPDDDAATLPMKSSAWMAAAEWCNIDNITNDECDRINEGGDALEGWGERAAMRHLELMRALERDGYELDEDERDFRSLCEKRIVELKRSKASRE